MNKMSQVIRDMIHNSMYTAFSLGELCTLTKVNLFSTTNDVLKLSQGKSHWGMDISPIVLSTSGGCFLQAEGYIYK